MQTIKNWRHEGGPRRGQRTLRVKMPFSSRVMLESLSWKQGSQCRMFWVGNRGHSVECSPLLSWGPPLWSLHGWCQSRWGWVCCFGENASSPPGEQSSNRNNQSVGQSTTDWLIESIYHWLIDWLINLPLINPTNQSTNQSINQPINQPINRSINQSTNQSINQPINRSINQSINQSTNQSINQPTNRSIDQSVGGATMWAHKYSRLGDGQTLQGKKTLP